MIVYRNVLSVCLSFLHRSRFLDLLYLSIVTAIFLNPKTARLRPEEL